MQSLTCEESVLNKDLNHQVDAIFWRHCLNQGNSLEHSSFGKWAKMESRTDTGEGQATKINHHETGEAGNPYRGMKTSLLPADNVIVVVDTSEYTGKLEDLIKKMVATVKWKKIQQWKLLQLLIKNE